MESGFSFYSHILKQTLKCHFNGFALSLPWFLGFFLLPFGFPASGPESERPCGGGPPCGALRRWQSYGVFLSAVIWRAPVKGTGSLLCVGHRGLAVWRLPSGFASLAEWPPYGSTSPQPGLWVAPWHKAVHAGSPAQRPLSAQCLPHCWLHGHM